MVNRMKKSRKHFFAQIKTIIKTKLILNTQIRILTKQWFKTKKTQKK